MPIFRDGERADVLQAAAAVAAELRAAGVRVRVDDRPEYRPGFKFNEWELKGVPLRIEIGGRDLAAAAVTVARRDTGEKQQIPLPRVPAAIEASCSPTSRRHCSAHARDEQERRTLRDPSGYDEMIDYLREPGGFVAAPWCGGSECEARVKDDSAATIRCLPLGRATDPAPRVRLLRSPGARRRRLGTGVLAPATAET